MPRKLKANCRSILILGIKYWQSDEQLAFKLDNDKEIVYREARLPNNNNKQRSTTDQYMAR